MSSKYVCVYMCVCVLPELGHIAYLTPGTGVAFMAFVVKGAALVKDSGSNPKHIRTSALLVLRLDGAREYAGEGGGFLDYLMSNMAWHLCC